MDHFLTIHIQGDTPGIIVPGRTVRLSVSVWT